MKHHYMSSIKKEKVKDKIYSKIENEKRLKLLFLVQTKKLNLKRSAEQLNIKYSTAKSILRLFRKENRILRKSTLGKVLTLPKVDSYFHIHKHEKSKGIANKIKIKKIKFNKSAKILQNWTINSCELLHELTYLVSYISHVITQIKENQANLIYLFKLLNFISFNESNHEINSLDRNNDMINI